jgi:hypothetical protein
LQFVNEGRTRQILDVYGVRKKESASAILKTAIPFGPIAVS